jgi:hypothetical protein
MSVPGVIDSPVALVHRLANSTFAGVFCCCTDGTCDLEYYWILFQQFDKSEISGRLTFSDHLITITVTTHVPKPTIFDA